MKRTVIVAAVLGLSSIAAPASAADIDSWHAGYVLTDQDVQDVRETRDERNLYLIHWQASQKVIVELQEDVWFLRQDVQTHTEEIQALEYKVTRKEATIQRLRNIIRGR